MPYHHDVILKVTASDDQLQVSDGPKPILQSGATIIHHVLHWKVIGSCPPLIMFVPTMTGWVFCENYLLQVVLQAVLNYVNWLQHLIQGLWLKKI